MSAHHPPESLPATLGRYRILGLLGQGGMGVVYRAEDERLGRHVALKMLPRALSKDPVAKERLRVEARAASALDHPHICTVYEVAEADDGRLFIAMACYEGQTLAETLKESGRLPVEEAVTIARQIASGLAAAHRKGIVHRDLKPSNIFLCREEEGQGPRAKILDFGVAKMEGVALTQPGATLGTIEYAAPEQAQGHADARSDLWALGVVLYEMLAGRRPFEGAYDAALLYAILNLDPEPVRTHRPEVPEALEAVVARFLVKDPSDRFQTAEAGEAALARAAGHAEPLHRPPRSRLSKRARLLGAGVLAVVLVLALWAGLQAKGPAIPDTMHIAVLPFTTDAEGSAFAAGLVEVLANELTQLEQYQGALWVVPVSEVRAQGITSAGEARRALGVTLAVTGSVQRDSERVRIPLNLVDATNLRQLRSVTLDAPLADLDALQTQVFAAIEAMLDLTVAPEVQRRRAAVRTDDAQAYDRYLRGLGHLQRYDVPGSLDRAVALFREVVASDSAFALAHVRLGETYWRLFTQRNEPAWAPLAEAEALRAATLAPDEAAPFILLARLRAATGDTDQALQAARRALTLAPHSGEAHQALAVVLSARGDQSGAERALREAVRLQPDAWFVHNALGAFYLDYGRYDEAVAPYQQIVRLLPDSPIGYNGLGAVYHSLGRYDEARAAYERAISLRPTYFALSNLGTILYDEGRYAEAAGMYEQALALDSNQYDVWGNLASVYELVPDLSARAPEAYRVAIRRAEAVRAVTPDNARLLAALASYYAEVGEAGRARSLVAEALRLDPENVIVAFDAGVLYEELGERDQALRWLRRAFEGGIPVDWAEGEEALRDLRDDPRYLALRDLPVQAEE